MCLLLFRPGLTLTLKHVEKDKNEDILVAIIEKSWDKTFIQSLNKEKRENAFRLMVKSHITEKRCSNPGFSFQTKDGGSVQSRPWIIAIKAQILSI